MNKRTADYLGLPKDHPLRFGIDIGSQWDAHIPLLHPDDHEESRKVWSTCLHRGEAGEISFRVDAPHSSATLPIQRALNQAKDRELFHLGMGKSIWRNPWNK